MENLLQRLSDQNWGAIIKELHKNGFVIVKNILTERECDELIAVYSNDALYRKTINMERYRFGKGEYKYFHYPLPELITTLREFVYSKIACVANHWMEELNIKKTFPSAHQDLRKHCCENGQNKPTVLLLKYDQGGYNTLHQDLYGEIYFPMQMVFVLDQPGRDFEGGEFIITEHQPRAQSKVNVLKPDMGDMIIFTTNFRPMKGMRGYYRVNMKHGVSPVHHGSRRSLGVIFHDGKN